MANRAQGVSVAMVARRHNLNPNQVFAAPRAPSPGSGAEQTSRLIEIRLRNGHSVVLRGRVDAEALSRVIDLLGAAMIALPAGVKGELPDAALQAFAEWNG